MELGELHRTIHGRTAEREVASGEMYRKARKPRPGRQGAGPSPASDPRSGFAGRQGQGHQARRLRFQCGLRRARERPATPEAAPGARAGPSPLLVDKEVGCC